MSRRDAMNIYSYAKRVQHTNTFSMRISATTCLFYRRSGFLGARWLHDATAGGGHQKRKNAGTKRVGGFARCAPLNIYPDWKGLGLSETSRNLKLSQPRTQEHEAASRPRTPRLGPRDPAPPTTHRAPDPAHTAVSPPLLGVVSWRAACSRLRAGAPRRIEPSSAPARATPERLPLTSWRRRSGRRSTRRRRRGGAWPPPHSPCV